MALFKKKKETKKKDEPTEVNVELQDDNAEQQQQQVRIVTEAEYLANMLAELHMKVDQLSAKVEELLQEAKS